MRVIFFLFSILFSLSSLAVGVGDTIFICYKDLGYQKVKAVNNDTGHPSYQIENGNWYSWQYLGNNKTDSFDGLKLGSIVYDVRGKVSQSINDIILCMTGSYLYQVGTQWTRGDDFYYHSAGEITHPFKNGDLVLIDNSHNFTSEWIEGALVDVMLNLSGPGYKAVYRIEKSNTDFFNAAKIVTQLSDQRVALGERVIACMAFSGCGQDNEVVSLAENKYGQFMKFKNGEWTQISKNYPSWARVTKSVNNPKFNLGDKVSRKNIGESQGVVVLVTGYASEIFDSSIIVYQTSDGIWSYAKDLTPVK